MVVVACLCVSWECVCQQTPPFPSVRRPQACTTLIYSQPTTRSLSFPASARGAWELDGGPCGDNPRDRRAPRCPREQDEGFGAQSRVAQESGCGDAGTSPSSPSSLPMPPSAQLWGPLGCPGGASPSPPPRGSWPEPTAAAAPLLPTSGAGPAPGLRCSGGMRRKLQ